MNFLRPIHICNVSRETAMTGAALALGTLRDTTQIVHFYKAWTYIYYTIDYTIFTKLYYLLLFSSGKFEQYRGTACHGKTLI